MDIYRYEAGRFTEWNAFNKSAKNGIFMFDRNYMDYHADRFSDHSLMFYEDSKLLALLPLNLKDNILYSHQGLTFGGFITDIKMKQVKMLECFALLQAYMRERGIGQLIYKALPYMYHKLPAQEDLYALFASGARLYRVDCNSSIDLRCEIALPKGRKAQIARARREGVDIESSQDFSTFITLLNHVLHSRHNLQAPHTADELALLHSRFPHNIALYVARQNNEILAGTLLFIYDNLVHTQYLAVNDKGRAIGALDLLIKTLIDKYTPTKQYFDFGISTENNGLYLNEGLVAQKEGFGARTTTHNVYGLSAFGADS